MEWDYDKMMESNPQFKQADIDELKRWVERLEFSSNIPKDISSSLLLCFYNACGLNVEDTKKCIQAYYTIRQQSPEFFNHRDMTLNELREISEALDICIFPEKTEEGYVIIYTSFRNTQPSKFNFTSYNKYFFMTVDRCFIEHGPVKGLVYVSNSEGLQLGHLSRINFAACPRLASYCQEGMPIKLKKIHTMNVSSMYEKLAALLYPLINKEVLAMIQLHLPTDNYESFHQNCLPKRCLPPNYGGTLPNVSVMSKKNVEKLIALKPYFDEEERQRLKYSGNQITGVFRSLDID